MRKIFALFSSLLLLTTVYVYSQNVDTVKADNSISIGIDLLGPLSYSLGEDVYNFDGFISYRLNYKYFLVAEAAFGSFSYEQYNYSYSSQGFTLRFGTDISMLKPDKFRINHFTGIGLRYGVSVFNQEIPVIIMDNYWGPINTSVEKNHSHAHYLEALGGVRAEIIKNISIGWSVRLRMLLFHSGKDQPVPVYIPGMGETEKTFASTVNYHIIFRFPSRPSSSE